MIMDNRRVVITGVGIVSPVGIGKDLFWDNLVNGVSGIKTIDYFDTAGYTSKIAGVVEGFDIEDYIDKKEARRMDRFQHFAIAGASMACADAGLIINDSNAERIGVIVGSGIGGIGSMADGHRTLLEKGPKRISPFLIPMMITDLAAGHISIVYGVKGPNYCTTSACASASHAIGEAFEIIRKGAADAMITGGAEAPITPLGVASFCAARALSGRNDEPAKASRPFDIDRDGFVIAEGAGILIIEELSHALNRGARIYTEIVGYGATADAYHVMQPDPTGSGAIRSMASAIDRSGHVLTDIDYINAHGTSTEVGDIAETKAIKKLFSDHAYKLLVSSTKSTTGHLLGAAGAIEAIACSMAINTGMAPPTVNLDNPDPECDLNYVPHRAVKKDIKLALSNSFGFGGHNASLIIRKFEE
jgi:3-oxoacyl-[acyl-carrier-protein] synthase II